MLSYIRVHISDAMDLILQADFDAIRSLILVQAHGTATRRLVSLRGSVAAVLDAHSLVVGARARRTFQNYLTLIEEYSCLPLQLSLVTMSRRRS